MISNIINSTVSEMVKTFLAEVETEEFRLKCRFIRTAIKHSSADVLIIHDNDQDGYAAAYILLHYIKSVHIDPMRVTSKAVGHGKPFQELNYDEIGPLETVFILDHECSPELVATLRAKCHEVIVVDHHPASLLHNSPFVLADKRWSTAALVSALVPPEKRVMTHSDLAAIVSHYDTWKFGSDDIFDEFVKNLFSGLRIRNDFKGDFQTLCKTDDFIASNCMVDCVNEGARVRAFQKKTMETVFTRSLRRGTLNCTIDGSDVSFTIGLIFHSDLIDELADYCLKNDFGLDLVAVVYLKDIEEGFKVSVRSRKNNGDKPVIDTRKISTLFGGGGHINASGFTATTESFSNFLTLIKT